MLVAGAFTVPTVSDANPDIKMGAMAIPGEKGENNTFGVPGMAYGVNKASSDDAKKAVKKFLSFVFDKEVSRQFSEETTLFTTLKDVEMKFPDPASTDFANMASSMVLIVALDQKVVDTNYNTQLWSDMQGLIAGKTNVYPVFLMVFTSLKTAGEVTGNPIGLPASPQWSNYAIGFINLTFDKKP